MHTYAGYLHGVMQAFFYDNRQTISLKTLTLNACAEYIEKAGAHPEIGNSGRIVFGCLHGVGHGLMYASNDDLSASLSACDELSAQWQQLACYDGAFMELATLYKKDSSTAARSQSMAKECARFKNDVVKRTMCTRYVGWAHLYEKSADFKGAFTDCLALTAADQKQCVDQTAFMIPTMHNIKNDTGAAFKDCSFAGPYQDTCVTRVARGIEECIEGVEKSIPEPCAFVDIKFKSACSVGLAQAAADPRSCTMQFTVPSTTPSR